MTPVRDRMHIVYTDLGINAQGKHEEYLNLGRLKLLVENGFVVEIDLHSTNKWHHGTEYNSMFRTAGAIYYQKNKLPERLSVTEVDKFEKKSRHTVNFAINALPGRVMDYIINHYQLKTADELAKDPNVNFQ